MRSVMEKVTNNPVKNPNARQESKSHVYRHAGIVRVKKKGRVMAAKLANKIIY